ncbi:MAG: 3',5'-cyclic adenosine monophosphate phosphodiesterase CpdA [Acidobacteria bacterium]|nr:3',5'-cyclic adenosine monophosphate phosphodiesterase CpdA [Acidobacteriota bacterium]
MKRRDFLALLSTTAATVFTARASARTPGKTLRTAINGFSPAPQPSTGTVRFIAFGDAGTGDRAQYDLARIMAAHHWDQPYDTVLLLGDNIYPDGDPADISAKFERPYAELLRRGVTFQAVLGNHDVRKGREAQINYPNFNMGGRAYYSFTRGDGMAEFFALDSTDFDRRQRQWVERALAESAAKWKIAYFHHPIYSSGDKHGSNLKLRAELEPLFIRHGVAAVLSGHDHTYERTQPQQGVQYFVAGSGGKLRRGDLRRDTSFFASGSDEASCFMSVEITPEKFSFKTIDLTGRVIDSGELAPRAAVRAAALGK